jgi:hypothetical protein
LTSPEETDLGLTVEMVVEDSAGALISDDSSFYGKHQPDFMLLGKCQSPVLTQSHVSRAVLNTRKRHTYSHIFKMQ